MEIAINCEREYRGFLARTGACSVPEESRGFDSAVRQVCPFSHFQKKWCFSRRWTLIMLMKHNADAYRLRAQRSRTSPSSSKSMSTPSRLCTASICRRFLQSITDRACLLTPQALTDRTFIWLGVFASRFASHSRTLLYQIEPVILSEIS